MNWWCIYMLKINEQTVIDLLNQYYAFTNDSCSELVQNVQNGKINAILSLLYNNGYTVEYINDKYLIY